MTNQKKPTARSLSAGGEIDAWCTRCRMDLGHRIVAMVTSTPKRVMCMTCNSEHNYRAPKGEGAGIKSTKTRASGTKKLTKKAVEAATLHEEWESRVASSDDFIAYTIHGSFSADQLVRHKKFGDGYVVGVAEKKVIVAFADGERTLARDVPL